MKGYDAEIGASPARIPGHRSLTFVLHDFDVSAAANRDYGDTETPAQGTGRASRLEPALRRGLRTTCLFGSKFMFSARVRVLTGGGEGARRRSPTVSTRWSCDPTSRLSPAPRSRPPRPTRDVRRQGRRVAARRRVCPTLTAAACPRRHGGEPLRPHPGGGHKSRRLTIPTCIALGANNP